MIMTGALAGGDSIDGACEGHGRLCQLQLHRPQLLPGHASASCHQVTRELHLLASGESCPVQCLWKDRRGPKAGTC